MAACVYMSDCLRACIYVSLYICMYVYLLPSLIPFLSVSLYLPPLPAYQHINILILPSMVPLLSLNGIINQSGWSNELSTCLPIWEIRESEDRGFESEACGFGT